MTSSVFTEPSPQYRDASGNVCAGGSLKFFASGTLNAQDVFSDSALATNIGATVPLGSDGRATSGTSTITVYLDDSLQYRAQLFDANGAKQWDVDQINPQAAVGNTIPALVNGYFLSNDGSQLLWDLIRQLPDPTGQSGKVLTTDGTGFSWIAKPADGTEGRGDRCLRACARDQPRRVAGADRGRLAADEPKQLDGARLSGLRRGIGGVAHQESSQSYVLARSMSMNSRRARWSRPFTLPSGVEVISAISS